MWRRLEIHFRHHLRSLGFTRMCRRDFVCEMCASRADSSKQGGCPRGLSSLTARTLKPPTGLMKAEHGPKSPNKNTRLHLDVSRGNSRSIQLLVRNFPYSERKLLKAGGECQQFILRPCWIPVNGVRHWVLKACVVSVVELQSHAFQEVSSQEIFLFKPSAIHEPHFWNEPTKLCQPHSFNKTPTTVCPGSKQQPAQFHCFSVWCYSATRVLDADNEETAVSHTVLGL